MPQPPKQKGSSGKRRNGDFNHKYSSIKNSPNHYSRPNFAAQPSFSNSSLFPALVSLQDQEKSALSQKSSDSVSEQHKKRYEVNGETSKKKPRRLRRHKWKIILATTVLVFVAVAIGVGVYLAVNQTPEHGMEGQKPSTTGPAVREPDFHVQIRMQNRQYTPQLAEPSSTVYQNTKVEMEKFMDAAMGSSNFSDLYDRSEVTRLRKDSKIMDYSVYFVPADRVQSNKDQARLEEAKQNATVVAEAISEGVQNLQHENKTTISVADVVVSTTASTTASAQITSTTSRVTIDGSEKKDDKVANFHLSGGNSSNYGLVYVTLNNTKGVLCADMNDRHYSVLCHSLGFISGEGYHQELPVPDGSKVWGTTFMRSCSDTSDNLEACRDSDWYTYRPFVAENTTKDRPPECKFGFAKAFCYATTVKLNSGGGNRTGILQVYFGSKYQDICRTNLTDSALGAMCQNATGLTNAHALYLSPKLFVGHSVSASVYLEPSCMELGRAAETCVERESRCRLDDLTAVHCYDGTIADAITGWDIDSNGRVVVERYGSLGFVCRDDFNDNIANLFCKSQGYRGGNRDRTYAYMDGRVPLWVQKFSCPTDAAHFSHCDVIQATSETQCFTRAAASVKCYSEEDYIKLYLVDSYTDGVIITGRVVAEKDNRIGYMCRSWKYDNMTAYAFCRMMNYSAGGFLATDQSMLPKLNLSKEAWSAQLHCASGGPELDVMRCLTDWNHRKLSDIKERNNVVHLEPTDCSRNLATFSCYAADEKPGLCPPSDESGITIHECQNDFECDGSKICCAVGGGAGQMCREPQSDTSEPTSTPSTTPTSQLWICPDFYMVWSFVSSPCMASLDAAKYSSHDKCSHYGSFLKCASLVMRLNRYHCTGHVIQQMALNHYWYFYTSGSSYETSGYPSSSGSSQGYYGSSSSGSPQGYYGSSSDYHGSSGSSQGYYGSSSDYHGSTGSYPYSSDSYFHRSSSDYFGSSSDYQESTSSYIYPSFSDSVYDGSSNYHGSTTNYIEESSSYYHDSHSSGYGGSSYDTSLPVLCKYHSEPYLADVDKTEPCANPDVYKYFLQYHCDDSDHISTPPHHSTSSSYYQTESQHSSSESYQDSNASRYPSSSLGYFGSSTEYNGTGEWYSSPSSDYLVSSPEYNGTGEWYSSSSSGYFGSSPEYNGTREWYSSSSSDYLVSSPAYSGSGEWYTSSSSGYLRSSSGYSGTEWYPSSGSDYLGSSSSYYTPSPGSHTTLQSTISDNACMRLSHKVRCIDKHIESLTGATCIASTMYSVIDRYSYAFLSTEVSMCNDLIQQLMSDNCFQILIKDKPSCLEYFHQISLSSNACSYFNLAVQCSIEKYPTVCTREHAPRILHQWLSAEQRMENISNSLGIHVSDSSRNNLFQCCCK